MKVFFEQKKPGRARQTIAPVEMDIEGNPDTVGMLIAATVMAMVEAFNRRASDAPDSDHADTARVWLDDDCLAALAETGRVAFGIVYNDRMADPEEAIANALQCYDDGLVRMFLNGAPLGDKDSAIELKDGDTLTVVRLTLLAGRLW